MFELHRHYLHAPLINVLLVYGCLLR